MWSWIKTLLRERERGRVLQLRVFKSLPTSHATAMCTRLYTCWGWATGVRELEAGPSGVEEELWEKGIGRQTGRYVLCCWTSNWSFQYQGIQLICRNLIMYRRLIHVSLRSYCPIDFGSLFLIPLYSPTCLCKLDLSKQVFKNNYIYLKKSLNIKFIPPSFFCRKWCLYSYLGVKMLFWNVACSSCRVTIWAILFF